MSGPHFICLGAQKAGTRWVYDQFSAHRAFWKAPIKELTYFDRGGSAANRERAKRRLSWRLKKQTKGRIDYHSEIDFLQRYLALDVGELPLHVGPYCGLFEDREGLTFDCTPGYSRLDEPSVRAMVSGLPETRFFLILRDPAERLWSQAQMHARLERQPYDPTESLEALQRFAARPSVRRFSFLADTVSCWRSLAGGRFGLFSFDALRRDAGSFRADLCAFLGVEVDGFTVKADHNRKEQRSSRGRVTTDMRAWMAAFFEAEYAALAALGLPDAQYWQARQGENAA